MFNSIEAEKAIELIETKTCLTTQENQEQMINSLMEIKHFYTLIRYESQKHYIIEFIKSMQVKKTQRGTIIYDKGIQNEGLYLVLKGSLSLWEPKSQGEINNEIGLITKLQKLNKITVQTDDLKKKIYQTQFQLDFSRKKEDDELFKHQDEQYFLTENICSLKRVKNVHAGDSLNEECVVSGAKTQYTVISMEDCYLLYISARDYLRIFDLEISKLNFILEVLKKNFGNSKIDSLRRLSYKFKEELFPYGSMIFNQDDPSNLLMIVQSGSVEISKITYPGQVEESNIIQKKKIKEKKINKDNEDKNKIKETKQNKENSKKKTNNKNKFQLEDEKTYQEYQKYYGTVNEQENDEDDENDQFKEKDEDIMKLKKKRKGGAKQKQTSVIAPVKFFKSQCLKLGIVGPGEVLGLEDFIKHKKRSFQAQSVSVDTLIYYVSKSKIDDIIDLNEDFNLKKAMKQNGSVKIDWYSDQQSKISQINQVNDLKNEENSSVLTVKSKFADQEDINFKSAVKKLFSDRRTKLVEEMIRKEENKSLIRIQNNPINTAQIQDQVQTENNNSDKDIKLTIISQIHTPQGSPSKDKSKNKNNYQSYNLLDTPQSISQFNKSNNQDFSTFSQRVIPEKSSFDFQNKIKQNLSPNNNNNRSSINENIRLKQILYGKQTSSTNNINITKEISSSEQQIKDNELDKQAEYENRFRTIIDIQDDQQKQKQTDGSLEPVQKKVYQNRKQSQLASQNNIEQDDLSKSTNKNEHLRNYQLETASLSLQQKIMYKIKNNILLQQKYKKHNAEDTKDFQDAKKFVKILRQSQQSKAQQTNSALKNMRDERQLSMGQILQKAMQDSQSSQSLLQIIAESDNHNGNSQKRISQYLSLPQMNEAFTSISKLPQTNGTISSLADEDKKEFLSQQNLQIQSQFPAIINSISPNHIDIQNIFKSRDVNHNNHNINNSQAMLSKGNIEERLSSMQRFQSPQNKNLNPSILSNQFIQNTMNSELNYTQTDQPAQTTSERKISHRKLESLSDIPSVLDTHHQNYDLKNLRESILLPQILNPSQSKVSLIASNKPNISPQISFSVKMSRKHINNKFQEIYVNSNNNSLNNKQRYLTQTDREIKYNNNNTSELNNSNTQNIQSHQQLITVNKLDISDNLQQKLQIRQQRQLSHEEKSFNKQKIVNKRSSVKLNLLNNSEFILNNTKEIMPFSGSINSSRQIPKKNNANISQFFTNIVN